MKTIQFLKDDNNITIVIPIAVLVKAGRLHPETPLKIKDKQAFAKEVMFELENNLGAVESGHTGFEELLDLAMMEVAESGHDFVDFKE